MTHAVTLNGRRLEMSGSMPRVGEKAPDFVVLDTELNRVVFSQLPPKQYVISAVPSLDTPVCDLETRRFGQEAAKLGPDVQVLTVSMDLPFAQKRWCQEAHVEHIRVLSDHKEASFGTAYGVLLADLRLLARAIFIVDKDRKVRYIQVVDEVTNEPDYDQVLQALKQTKGV